MRHRVLISAPATAFLLFLATLAPMAKAAEYRVGAGGTGEGCTHASVQAAIDTAQSNPGADTIRVARSQPYTAQELIVNTSQELTIIGGYDNCDSTTPSGMTILSGEGGNPRQVLRISTPDGGVVRLHHLMIRDADPASDADGGGIYFTGNGLLELRDSSVIHNNAGYGAGIYANGTGTNAELAFGQNVVVSNNTARHSGGGVYVNQLEFSMREAGSSILLNTAQGQGGGGYGGGLMIRASSLSAYAYIGSGTPGFGAIYGNIGVFGGGVAVVGDNSGASRDAELHLYPTVAGQPATIRNNIASQRGGGIYLRPVDDHVVTTARLWNAEIAANTAPVGAAFYGDSSGESVAVVSINNPGNFPGGAAMCATSQFCGGIIDNRAETPDGTATSGAVIHLESYSHMYIGYNTAGPGLSRGGIRIEGNQGGRLIQADGGVHVLNNVLIADNQTSDVLIRHDWGTLEISDSTVVGNDIGGSHVFIKGSGEHPGQYRVDRSILWQPGMTILQCSGCIKEFEHVIASERDSLDGGQTPYVQTSPPRFIDPDRGDYRLRAASPAIDYAPAITGDDRDALGLPRDQDMPVVSNWNGVRDLGAFERQALMPLVLNADFDVDVNLWTELFTGVSFWTNEHNAVGATGSGSIKVTQTNVAYGQGIRGRQQCIHLPGPGVYTLNGRGRGTGNALVGGDIAQLQWEYRRDGGEACTQGTPVSSGALTLSNSASWSQAFAPAQIVVTPEDWMHTSSITINLVGIESGASSNPRTTSTWFDGITLEITSLDDVIFADDFEP